MRYYIINNQGHVLGESNLKRECELILENYSEQEIEEQEIEIIIDTYPVRSCPLRNSVPGGRYWEPGEDKTQEEAETEWKEWDGAIRFDPELPFN